MTWVQITTHESLIGWEDQWQLAQQSDMQVTVETINEVLRDEAKVKAIQILGDQAVHTFNEILDLVRLVLCLPFLICLHFFGNLTWLESFWLGSGSGNREQHREGDQDAGLKARDFLTF